MYLLNEQINSYSWTAEQSQSLMVCIISRRHNYAIKKVNNILFQMSYKYTLAHTHKHHKYFDSIE